MTMMERGVLHICACICGLMLSGFVRSIKYQPNWKSIDSRPLPSWYDEAKIGIFIHWGVFSVPSVQSEWFWYYWKAMKTPETVKYMKNNFKPDFTYQDFAADFTAEFYNPDKWAEIFAASGARYVVLTSKHHEGFTNWPSKYAYSWNSMDVGPKRDLVGELAHSIRTKTPHIRFGLYHSLFEWFNPLYLEDERNNWTTNSFVRFKTMPELYEIVQTYKPEVVWSDAPMMGPDWYWNSTEFIAWLYNESPVKDTVVTNDRWGHGILCHHGGYFTCHDRYNPGVLQKRKWESELTLDRTAWGFRRQMKLSDVMTMKEVIKTLAEVVSCGGNILFNVGPTKDGRIVPIFEERLRSLGYWLNVNGEAIYSTTPWAYQNDTVTQGVWYTSKKAEEGQLVYAIVLNWPEDSQHLTLMSPRPTEKTSVTFLGYSDPIPWGYATPGHQGIALQLPKIPFNYMPCDHAWVFRMTDLA